MIKSEAYGKYKGYIILKTIGLKPPIYSIEDLEVAFKSPDEALRYVNSLSSRKNTGEMSKSDLEKGGEWYEARLELESLCKKAGYKGEVYPFDVYQGPYAFISGIGSVWFSSENDPYNYFLKISGKKIKFYGFNTSKELKELIESKKSRKNTEKLWGIYDWAMNRIHPELDFTDFEDAWGYIRENYPEEDFEELAVYEIKEIEKKNPKTINNVYMTIDGLRKFKLIDFEPHPGEFWKKEMSQSELKKFLKLYKLHLDNEYNIVEDKTQTVYGILSRKPAHSLYKTNPKKPPKYWWDYMVKKIKKDMPSYNKKQIDATVGKIWWHNLTQKKRDEIIKKEWKNPYNIFERQKEIIEMLNFYNVGKETKINTDINYVECIYDIKDKNHAKLIRSSFDSEGYFTKLKSLSPNTISLIIPNKKMREEWEEKEWKNIKEQWFTGEIKKVYDSPQWRKGAKTFFIKINDLEEVESILFPERFDKGLKDGMKIKYTKYLKPDGSFLINEIRKIKE